MEAVLSTFYGKPVGNDPVTDEVLRAAGKLSKPKRSISDGMGGKRELTSEEFSAYLERAGRYIR